MAVNVTRISDLETRNRMTSSPVTWKAVSGFPRIVGRSAANFKSPDSPQSPISWRTRRHFVNDVWPSPFLFSTLRNGTRCAFTLVHGDDADPRINEQVNRSEAKGGYMATQPASV